MGSTKERFNEKEWYREKIIRMAKETQDALVLRFICTIFHETIARRGETRNGN